MTAPGLHPAADMPPDLGRLDLGDVVERFDHLAMAVADIRSALPLVDLLGGIYRKGDHHHRGGFRWVQFSLPGEATLELISPLDPTDGDNFIVRFLDRRGEGPHHVTLKVRDLDTAIAGAQERGFEVVGRDDTDPAWREAFVHPGSAHGLLVQLADFDDASEPEGLSLVEAMEAPVGRIPPR